jgi:hypothetical protein
MSIRSCAVGLSLTAWVLLAPYAFAREEICLNGPWQLHLGGDEWNVPQQGYASCRVPGKFGGAWAVEFGGDDARQCGWYRLDFPVPAEWTGQRILLNFVRVAAFAKVFLDGNLVGDHPDGNTAFAIDITGKATPGHVHRLHVFVQGWSRFKKPNVKEYVWPTVMNEQAGILGDVLLSSSHPLHIDDTFVITSVRKKTLTARVWIKNSSSLPQRATLESAVKLDTSTVFAIPDQTVDLQPGEVKRVEIVRAWPDPKLWGFPPYGTPTLYHLQCSLKDSAARQLDQSYTRFGFREFWIEGDKFLLNGRPIFLQGEQSTFRTSVLYPHNRQWLMTYFLAMRKANVNSFRLGHDTFWPVWADVADETGMLLEAEPLGGIPAAGFGEDLASGAAVLAAGAAAAWPDDAFLQKHFASAREFVRQWRNHPSVVMWSTDNEGGSQSTQADVRYFQSIKKLKKLIRDVDPTRPIDHEGSPLISAAKKMGVDLVPDIYNIHPYSDPITNDVTKYSKQHFYSGQPILIGELFNDYPKIQPAPDPAMQAGRKEAWARTQSFADYWYRNILAAKKADYAGTFILTLANSAFWGFSSEDTIVNGPFGFHAGTVPVTWPSLSGPSPKPENLPNGIPWDSFNWFDATKPAYVPNYIYSRVKAAYGQINGGDLPPLPATRIAELIAEVQHQGKPLPEAYVYLVPAEGQPAETLGIRADAEGKAWFQVTSEGKYTLEYRNGPTPQRLAITLQRPPCEARPGYGHIRHIVFDVANPSLVKVDNGPAGSAHVEPDIVWRCLPEEPEKKKAATASVDSPNTIDLTKCIDEDGVLSKKAKAHRLQIFLKQEDVTAKWKSWNGAVWLYPNNTKADAFVVYMRAPKPGNYRILFHKPVISPERSAAMYVGEDPKPRLTLNGNAADLGLVFSVANRDAAYSITLADQDIADGWVRLRFQATSWMPAVIPSITLTPGDKWGGRTPSSPAPLPRAGQGS